MENRILVVDDEVDLVKTIQFSLEIEGYMVLAWNDGVVKKARNSKKLFDMTKILSTSILSLMLCHK